MTKLQVAFCLCLALETNGQEYKIKNKAYQLIQILEEQHYQPVDLDDQFSEQVFNNFISDLDPEKKYFLETEVKTLHHASLRIDDELKEDSSWKFLTQATQLYKKCLERALVTCENVVNSNLNPPQTEYFKIAGEVPEFPHDHIELRSIWRKRIKLLVLKDLVQEQAQNTNNSVSPTQEAIARKKALKVEKSKIQRLVDTPEGFENSIGNLFINSIANCYDPHTIYLSGSEWENFESDMSDKEYSFGFTMRDNEYGEVLIDRLIPGGPAWKTNELHKGDVLNKIQWDGNEVFDLIGADVQMVENLLQASSKQKIKLTVTQLNGISKTISLAKEKIANDENIVKSFILQGSIKAGYISLPGFYSEFENNSSGGCANDVAKEILKLKEEGIQSLILDIRSNGGGSLLEGLNMAGLFINEGPLFMIKDKSGNVRVAKDLNRGTVYDGPLILLVNSGSASASEIIAVALQDYRRAIIVGTSTYGKSTCQTIIPLNSKDDIASKKSQSEESSAVAVTIGKMYRITGNSAQLHGVLPDIILPDIYESLYNKEKDYPNALLSDSVFKKVVFKPFFAPPYELLKERSIERLKNKKWYNTINSFSDSLQHMLDETIELSERGILEEQKKIEALQTFEYLFDIPSENYTVHNTAYDNLLYTIDNYSKEMNAVVKEKIFTDVYIQESYNIASDLVKLNK